MPNENNPPPQRGEKRPSADSVLTLPPRKKAGPPDYWKNKGRHIGRTMHIFINVGQLIVAGLQIDKDLALSSSANSIDQYSAEVRLEYQIYLQVLRCLPDLEEGLINGTIGTERLNEIATRLQSGISAARSDDVKGVKNAIIQWITDPEKGLVPPLDPRFMTNRGWNHDATGRELCPAGLDWDDPSIRSRLQNKTLLVSSDQWPICFYLNNAYDPTRPWRGLLRGRLLVNAYKHIFTSPSSVDNSGRATKASNSSLHAMTKVTPASIVYVATIVRFSLGSMPTFTRNDTTTDSQAFYNLLLAFLTHPQEVQNLNELLAWWNKQVFPNIVESMKAPTAQSPYAMCLAERKRRMALEVTNANTQG